ncbi:substrate-binding domain-containing protein [Micromonospora vinacea]|uniref:substrate-binding domain-containing protein n=1 Tax=Micromonospora vinacea TaxID=709878 RepID=UPI003F56E0C7
MGAAGRGNPAVGRGSDRRDLLRQRCRLNPTSIDMDPEGIGRTTADLLLGAINGEPVHDQRAGPCRLVPRDSIAVPVLRSDSRRHASPGASRGVANRA